MSRHLRINDTWLALAVGCLAAGVVLADEPAQWLERMNNALSTRNYDGTYSHWHGGEVDMMRIVHRVQNGVVSERLASLDGSGNEFIRTGSSVACYLPKQRTVVVEQRGQNEPLVAFPKVDEQTAAFYDIREVARTRFNRRDTHVITVMPRDEFRYGYRLWIDDSTAMPLKSQLCDPHGAVIEQIVFASLTLSAHIPDAAFKPEVSTEGFTWVRGLVPAPAPPVDFNAWNALHLPPGFHIVVRSAQTLPGSSQPVGHLVYTDGVASVSVFVEVQQAPPAGAGDAAAAPPVDETATLGASSAFSTVVDGHKITAVGEVPPRTVHDIATQVRAQGVSPVGARGP